MRLLDSRRLTGPSLLLDRAGAILEVAFTPAPGAAGLRDEAALAPGPGAAPAAALQGPDAAPAGAAQEPDAASAVAAWREEAARLLAALGWGGERLAARLHPGGASLALTAPIDALYAATEVAEAAWAAAESRLAGEPAPPFDEAVSRLREAIERESNPALLRLGAAAEARGVQFLWDEEAASVGSGTGVLTWPVGDLPAPDAVDWPAVDDVPVLLVTGTNGKTTTVRLLGAMIAAAGRVPGLTSTDQVTVGGEVLARGDFSGSEGARLLLRDRRVEVAVLEAARGGILRRGLSVRHATAALVTNIAADHLGEFGIDDLAGLAEAKLVVAKALGPGGRMVLNADDPELVSQGSEPGRFRAPVAWFGLDPGAPPLAAHLAAGGEAALLEGGALVLRRGAERREVARAGEIPIAFGGAATYNLANALAALALGSAAGLAVEAMAEGLRGFGRAPEENPGRAHLFDLDGARVLVDYAHNPHGLAALFHLVESLPASRRLVLIGQAGDRDEEAIRQLARAAWRFHPDRVVVKELTSMLRGRAPGEVPAILEDELRRLGAVEDAVVYGGDEVEAVRAALAWARPGDLLVLLVHTDRQAVLDLLRAASPASR